MCWALARTALGAAAAPLAILAAVSALLAAAALAATGGPAARRFGVPEALPRLVAWTGTGASAGMAAATLVLSCTATATAHWPLLLLLAGALSAARLARRAGHLRPSVPPLPRARGLTPRPASPHPC